MQEVLQLRNAVKYGAILFVIVTVIAASMGVSAKEPDRYSFAEIHAMRKEDDRKPTFFGNMNGITFAEWIDMGCSSKTVPGTVEQVAASPLNFSLDYLPSGLAQSEEYRGSCDERLILLSRVYQGANGQLTIMRLAGNTTQSFAPADRMQKISVGGKNAVLIRALPVPGVARETATGQWRSWRLIIPGSTGLTEIQSAGVTLDEGLKVARSIK